MSELRPSDEEQGDYYDYLDNTPADEFECPYCGSPSDEVHTITCRTNLFTD